jgi:HlyD family secretion protein
MITKYVLPLLAIAGVSFAIYSVFQAAKVPPVAKANMAPTSRPARFDSVIAGAGLVEAKMENVPIGSPTPGVVTSVDVKVGNRVEHGAPLFRLDDRSLKAELSVREAMLDAAKAELHKLESAPRPEDVPPAQAALDEAKAKLNDAEAAMSRTQRLFDRQMIPASDFDRDRFAYYAAKATVERAQADLQRILAGTWKEDLLVSRARVKQAESEVERVRIELDRLIVRAPTDGEVLQVNVRPGQFAALAWREPMIVLGDVDQLNLRVDIDEHDLPLYNTEMEATAYVRGRPEQPFKLEKIVKIEPYVIPKKSLTGDNAERVDTRVLQVIYALPVDRPFRVFVGQQMDVYFGKSMPDGPARPAPKTATIGQFSASDNRATAEPASLEALVSPR